MPAPHPLDPPSGVMSAQTPRDFSHWHSKRSVLHNLYIGQGKNLNDVKTIMEREHGFPKTLKHSDYEHVLREEFKYRKNLSSDEWRLSIGPQIARRKAEGKRSEVLLNGTKVQNVNRRIQRSFQSKRSRRLAKVHTAVLPHGVIIRTPSPRPLTPRSLLGVGEGIIVKEIQEHDRYQSLLKDLADSSTELDWLGLLTGVTPLSDAGSETIIRLSTQILREDCPINQFLTMLDEYQRKLHLAHLRLFGPNVTVGLLGKICFDFSNNLQQETISEREMILILNWIGFSVDITSLKIFFSQKVFTILAAWEGLSETVLNLQHQEAFDVLSAVYSSIKDSTPWTIREPYSFLSTGVTTVPDRLRFRVHQWASSQSTISTISTTAPTPSIKSPIELLKQMISAGASLKAAHNCACAAHLIQYIANRGEESDLALLNIVLEADAVVDEPPLFGTDSRSVRSVGWQTPGGPMYLTDYLLLSGNYSNRSYGLRSLISLHSDRQQTTVTVPGVFHFTQGGQGQLHSYLSSRLKPYNEQERSLVLEVALSEASAMRHTSAVQNLVQLGVDPNVRMLLQSDRDYGDRHTWHPVIRAVNTGNIDTLRILLAVSSIEITLLGEKVVSHLDLCALRRMENSKRDQILRVFSTLDLPTYSRSKVLLRAIEPDCLGCHRHFGPDYGLASQLLELGLACLDYREHVEGQTSHILVRAIEAGCDVRALKYLVQRDVRILSTLSADIVGALLKAIIMLSRKRHEILGFLAQNVEGVRSYIRDHGSSLLLCLLEHHHCEIGVGRSHWEDGCEAMTILKWFLDFVVPLKGTILAGLLEHADDSFMLSMIHSVTNISAEDNCDALRSSIRLGRLNLAVVLIGRGVDVNDIRAQEDGLSPLQHACEKGAPLWFIRFLIEEGADVNALPASDGGRTALQAACGGCTQLSCIGFLIDKGADINAPPALKYGATALQCAAYEGLMNVAGLLLDHGADVNALSGVVEGDSYSYMNMRAIDFAAEFSRLDMVHFLIAAGARSHHPGSTGFEGAIEIATREGHFAIACLLQEHADSRSDDPMEAERIWLRDNPHACMYKGRIQAQSWVDFVKSVGEDGEPDVAKYIDEVDSRR